MNKISIKSIKQFFLLFAANAGVAFFGFLINVIITKTSSPVIYGEYRFALNVFYIVVLVFQFGYTNTASNVVARVSGGEQIRFISSMFFISFVLGAFACVVQVIFLSILGVVTQNNLYWEIMVFSPYVFFYFLQTVIVSILIGQNKIKLLSYITIIPYLVYVLFLFAYVSFNSVDSFVPLLAGYCLINVAVTLFSVWLCKPEINKFRSAVSEINGKNLDFGMKIYFGSLVGVGGMYFVGLFSTATIGIKEYAYFSLGFSFVAPFQMISSVMGSVMYRVNSEAKKIRGNVFALVFSAAFFSVLVFSVIIDSAFPYIFSDKYIKALPYVKILALYGAILGGGDFINKFLCSQGCGRQVMRVSILGGLALIFMALMLVPAFGTYGLLAAYIFSSCIYLLLMVKSYRIFIQNKI